MGEARQRGIHKPPRPTVGNLQKLPTYPWMFSWPTSAYDRSYLTNGAYHGFDYPCPSRSGTSYPYKRHWQFRDHSADDRTHPAFLDLRGGPANLTTVSEYTAYPTPHPEIFKGQDEETHFTERYNHLVMERKEQKMWKEWLKIYGEKYYYY